MVSSIQSFFCRIALLMMHRPFLALDQVHQLLDALILDKGHQDWSVRLIHVGSALSRLL